MLFYDFEIEFTTLILLVRWGLCAVTVHFFFIIIEKASISFLHLHLLTNIFAVHTHFKFPLDNMWPIVTRCHHLWPFETTSHKLWPPVTTFDQPGPPLSTCERLRLIVTSCFGHLWAPVVICDHMWPPVTTDHMWAPVTWPPVTTCDHMWPLVTICDHLWPPVTSCDYFWPPVTTCDHPWPPVTWTTKLAGQIFEFSFRILAFSSAPGNFKPREF